MTNIEDAYAQWRDQHDQEPSLKEAFEAGAKVQSPTRDQAYEAVSAAMGGKSLTQWERAAVDALLALFPQSTQSAEPTVRLPVTLIEQAPHDRKCASFSWNGVGWDHDDAACDCWKAGLFPPAPITRASAAKHAYIDGRFGDDGICHATTDAGYPHRCYRPRNDSVHVTPPLA